MPRIKYISLILVSVNVVIFLVQAALPGFTDNFALLSSDAASRPWIILTSIFLHGSAAHLISNMFILALFGLILENIIGSKKFAAIYFAAGIVSSLISMPFYPASLGASGAIFGLLGTLATIRPKMVVWTYGVPMPMIAAAFFWLILDLLGTFFPTNVANIAHIAGLVFGAAAGMIIRKPAQKMRREKIISDEEFEEWEKGWREARMRQYICFAYMENQRFSCTSKASLYYV